MKYSKYNIVIIGSGIAGLYLANKLTLGSDSSSNFADGILLITKDELFSGSSALAQGGIVSVIPEINPDDSYESHIKDTLSAGCGLNNLNAVKFVSENSYSIAQELIQFGVEFDRNDKNFLNFTLEGAHSHPRILHAGGDSTGRIIEKTLCENLKNAQNLDIYENTAALELLVDKTQTTRGLIVYNSKNRYYEAVYSNAIIIATGGIGQIYKNTTNPDVSTGDGIAMAYRAGAEVENMEFVQFHPTALYCKDKKTLPLVSESVRGEGAKLVDSKGDYFAKNYHKLADLAPRDVVSRAIISKMKENDSQYTNLDISQIGIEKFKQRFPTITSLCIENDMDFSNGLIKVAPAQHYFMGGIKVDLDSKTSLKNLYAIGECASTGLHGANRLASNSLLECCVFAKKLSEDFIKNPPKAPENFDEKIKKLTDEYDNKDIFDETQNENIEKLFILLKSTMTDNVGIIRSKKGLEEALRTLDLIDNKLNKETFESKLKFELNNALVISRLIARSALERENSLGAHFRSDEVKDTNNKNKGNLTNDEILAQ